MRALLRDVIWPVLFWLWVGGVSLWIEESAVREAESPPAAQKYSSIHFTRMRFEQLYGDNNQLVVESPEARFDSETKHLSLLQPRLWWKKGAAGVIFSATGTQGLVLTEVGDTALPSEFQLLELSEGAHAEGKNSSVDSNRLLLDNKTHLFYCPGAYVSRMEDRTLRSKEGMIYDPQNDRMERLRDPKGIPKIQ